MIIELSIRLLIALIIGVVSTTFLTLSFILLKKNFDLKKNVITSGVFALLLFSFSFFPNIILSILTGIVMLLLIKYMYINRWSEALSIWALWMLMWIVLFGLIAGVIFLAQPYNSPF